jgi:hypothetical protein
VDAVALPPVVVLADVVLLALALLEVVAPAAPPLVSGVGTR